MKITKKTLPCLAVVVLVALKCVAANLDGKTAWSRSSAESLVATWCDALLDRQISGTGDKMIDGGIACPACGVMHGRVCDLASFGAVGRAVAGVDAVDPQGGAKSPVWSQSGNTLKVECDAKSFAYRISFGVTRW